MRYPIYKNVIFALILAVALAWPGAVGAYTLSLDITGLDDTSKTVFLPDEKIKVHIILDERSQVAGCALTLNYDPAVLLPPVTTAEALANPQSDVVFSLIPATNSDFSTDHRVNVAEPGKIYLSGAAVNEIDGGANELPGKTTLFTVIFTVKLDIAANTTFDFSLTQSEVFNPSAGYGTDSNGNGLFDTGTDTRDRIPVLVGAVDNTSADWNNLGQAFPVLLSDTTTPAFASVQSTQLTVLDPFLSVPNLPTGYTRDQPTTYPLLTLGQTTTLAVSDPTRLYDWSVVPDPDWISNAAVVASGTDVTTIPLDPDVLFNAHGAGVYKVTVVDSEIDSRFFVFYVRIPMKITPMEGTYEISNADINVTFAVTGGPNSTVYIYSAVDQGGTAVTPANYGSFANANPTSSSNPLVLNHLISELKTFQVVVTLDGNQDHPDVSRLKKAELDTARTLFHRVVPVLSYSGTVVSDTDPNLTGGKVTTKHKPSIFAAIQADGTFDFSPTTFRRIPDVIYRFYVSADDHADKEVTGDELGAVTLEKLPAPGNISGTVTLTGDLAPFEPGAAVVISVTADGAPMLDGDGSPVRTLVNPLDGTYSLLVPSTFTAGVAEYTVTAHKKGYHDASDTFFGPLPLTTADLIMTPRTIITVSALPGDDTTGAAGGGPDGTPDSVDVSITAKAGAVTISNFGGLLKPNQIEVLINGSPVPLTWPAPNPNLAWTFNYGAYETFTMTVNADITDDDNINTNTPETLIHTYVKASTAPQDAQLADPMILGAKETIGNATVSLPPGGLIGEIIDKVFVAVIEANPDAAGIGSVITGSEIVEIVMTDVDGETVPNTSLQRFEITLAFNPANVPEGSLEAGQMVIFQANSMAAMVSRSFTAVPVSQIILADYVNGKVTFWVDHLSAFGIGAPGSGGSAATAAAGSGGGGSGCFIATAAHGSRMEPHVQILRQFRDVYLLPNRAGGWLVQNYYRYSPPVADMIAEYGTLRAIVRILLAPAVAVSYVALHTTAAQKTAILMLIVGLMLAGIFYAARWRRRRLLVQRRDNR